MENPYSHTISFLIRLLFWANLMAFSVLHNTSWQKVTISCAFKKLWVPLFSLSSILNCIKMTSHFNNLANQDWPEEAFKLYRYIAAVFLRVLLPCNLVSVILHIHFLWMNVLAFQKTSDFFFKFILFCYGSPCNYWTTSFLNMTSWFIVCLSNLKIDVKTILFLRHTIQ